MRKGPVFEINDEETGALLGHMQVVQHTSGLYETRVRFFTKDQQRSEDQFIHLMGQFLGTKVQPASGSAAGLWRDT